VKIFNQLLIGTTIFLSSFFLLVFNVNAATIVSQEQTDGTDFQMTIGDPYLGIIWQVTIPPEADQITTLKIRAGDNACLTGDDNLALDVGQFDCQSNSAIAGYLEGGQVIDFNMFDFSATAAEYTYDISSAGLTAGTYCFLLISSCEIGIITGATNEFYPYQFDAVEYNPVYFTDTQESPYFVLSGSVNESGGSTTSTSTACAAPHSPEADMICLLSEIITTSVNLTIMSLSYFGWIIITVCLLLFITIIYLLFKRIL